MGELRLDQQALDVEPATDDWCWGVDPGANIVGFAASNGQERLVKRLVLGGAGAPVAQRMHELYAAVTELAMNTLMPLPVLVVCEATIGYGHAGARMSPIVSQANGVVQAAVYGALRGHKIPVLEMEPATWKKAGLGRGNARKEEILRWAQELLPDVEMGQDEADALGMAEAARRAACR